jgi:hypothetical protein
VFNQNSKEGPIESQVSTVENLPTFTLENRRETQTIRGRRESIQTAKKMSHMGGPTQVKRADGMVSMTFRSGNLVQYKRESGRRR